MRSGILSVASISAAIGRISLSTIRRIASRMASWVSLKYGIWLLRGLDFNGSTNYSRRTLIPVKLPPMSDYSKYQCLRIEKAGKLATVTLNRPETRNQIDRPFHHELQDIWRDLAEDTDINAV